MIFGSRNIKFGCKAAKHARVDDEGRRLWLFGTAGLEGDKSQIHLVRNPATRFIPRNHCSRITQFRGDKIRGDGDAASEKRMTNLWQWASCGVPALTYRWTALGGGVQMWSGIQVEPKVWCYYFDVASAFNLASHRKIEDNTRSS